MALVCTIMDAYESLLYDLRLCYRFSTYFIFIDYTLMVYIVLNYFEFYKCVVLYVYTFYVL